MVEGSPPRVREPLPRPKRLQDRTLRVRPREGAGLVSERDLRRDRASRLLKAEHSPLSVEPPLLPQFSCVTFALGTRQILVDFISHRAYLYHISVMQDITAEEAEALTAPVTRHMEWNSAQWHFIKEEDPLGYSVLLNDLFEEVHGYHLEYLDHYTEWINPRGWCHKVILEKEQLNYCAHLTGAEPPPSDVERLSEATLQSHRAGYEAAKQGGTGKNYKKAWATLLETLKIHGLKEEYDYIKGGEKGPPLNRSGPVPMEVGGEGETAVNQGGGDAPLGHQKASWEEQVQAEEE